LTTSAAVPVPLRRPSGELVERWASQSGAGLRRLGSWRRLTHWATMPRFSQGAEAPGKTPVLNGPRFTFPATAIDPNP